MVSMSVSQMNQRLEQLKSFFSKQTQCFSAAIGRHEGKLTAADHREFQSLLGELRKYVYDQMSAFIQAKLKVRCGAYDHYIHIYQEQSNQNQAELSAFRDNVQDNTLKLKETQVKNQALLDHMSRRFSEHISFKKAWRVLEEYRRVKQANRLKDQEADSVYRKNLLNKVFFPWRTLTYKDGHENTVRREAERDLQNIHQQYQSIIQILKGKINETEEVIKVKKAAKGEFAFALSKNILKTISNLSIEVMSLNQMSLRDGEVQGDSTKKFMEQVDTVIQDKLNKVRDYRRGLVAETNENGEEDKKKKKITFA